MRTRIAPILLSAWLCSWGMELGAQAHFLRGDANHDTRLGIADPVTALRFRFLGAPEPPCLDAADFDDSGTIEVADAVGELMVLFLGGAGPAAPFPAFEADPTEDELGCLGDPVSLEGEIAQDLALTRDRVYRLTGLVTVRAGFTLSIEAGTTLAAAAGTDAILLIERGARIRAEGTATQPVVFTSESPAGERGPGAWGGIVMLGRASHNANAADCAAEGGWWCWDGMDQPLDADSSGVLSHVRIEYGGAEVSPNNELPALTLAGVGSATRLDHIQIRWPLADGVEIKGGTCDLKHVLVLDGGDEGFDLDTGWRGKGQFWICRQRSGSSGHGIQAGNSDWDFLARPLQRPQLANLTLVGSAQDDQSSSGGIGLLLFRGTGGLIHNAIVAGFGRAGAQLRDSPTCATIADGDLALDHSIFHRNGAAGVGHANDDPAECPTRAFLARASSANELLDDPALSRAPVADAYRPTLPDFRPRAEARFSALDPATIDPFFDSAPYKGAIAPEGPDWTRERWLSWSTP